MLSVTNSMRKFGDTIQMTISVIYLLKYHIDISVSIHQEIPCDVL